METQKANFNNIPVTQEFFEKALKMDLHSINALVVTLIKNPKISRLIADEMFLEYEAQEAKKASLENLETKPQ